MENYEVLDLTNLQELTLLDGICRRCKRIQLHITKPKWNTIGCHLAYWISDARVTFEVVNNGTHPIRIHTCLNSL